MSDDGWTRLNLVLLRPLAGAELKLDTPPCRDWEARAVEELFGMLMRRKAMQLLADEQWVRLTLRPLVSGSSGRAGERHQIPETEWGRWFDEAVSAALRDPAVVTETPV